jgi:hypothetical protein
MQDIGDKWVGTYRYVIRSVLWVIYAAVIVAFLVWWART